MVSLSPFCPSSLVETAHRHWSIDLIHLYSIISRPHSPSSKSRTLRLLLHLSAPPTDKLMLPASAEACRTQFINQVKEADFVRWRNTNKVTSLRRADLEAGWDGIVQGQLCPTYRMRQLMSG